MHLKKGRLWGSSLWLERLVREFLICLSRWFWIVHKSRRVDHDARNGVLMRLEKFLYLHKRSMRKLRRDDRRRVSEVAIRYG